MALLLFFHLLTKFTYAIYILCMLYMNLHHIQAHHIHAHAQAHPFLVDQSLYAHVYNIQITLCISIYLSFFVCMCVYVCGHTHIFRVALFPLFVVETAEQPFGGNAISTSNFFLIARCDSLHIAHSVATQWRELPSYQKAQVYVVCVCACVVYMCVILI